MSRLDSVFALALGANHTINALLPRTRGSTESFMNKLILSRGIHVSYIEVT